MTTMSIVFFSKLTILLDIDKQQLQFDIFEWIFGNVDKPYGERLSFY